MTHHRRTRRARTAVTALVAMAAVWAPVAVTSACSNNDPASGSAASTSASSATTTPTTTPTVERLRVQVVATHPHDRSAFTQGLLLENGVLYESTGIEGASSVRRVAIDNHVLLTRRDNAPTDFGEGLTKVGERLIQLTWKQGVARTYNAETLEPGPDLTYEGEGWGLTDIDDTRLIMSDGSSRLTFRDPTTFSVTGGVDVTEDGRPVDRINELEWDPKQRVVWANIWQTDRIVRIDPESGRVTGSVDASNLLAETDRNGTEDVLNGIAVVPGTDHYLITGKHWPTMFEVRFVPV